MADMTYRPLGSSGLMVSTVGIGCNAFSRRADAEATRGIVDAAIEQGITLFDTADIYGSEPGASETMLGTALGSRREQVVVATKFGMDMQGKNGPDWGVRGSRRYVRKAVEASLRRLGTDWIDLYQLHQLDRSVEAELVPACEHLGVGILPFFPLEYGLLTGKYSRGQAAPEGSRLAIEQARFEGADWDRIEALEAFAAERGLSMLQVAMGGLAAQPAVTSVIAGVTRPEQVVSNAQAGLWDPTAEDLAALEALG